MAARIGELVVISRRNTGAAYQQVIIGLRIIYTNGRHIQRVIKLRGYRQLR